MSVFRCLDWVELPPERMVCLLPSGHIGEHRHRRLSGAVAELAEVDRQCRELEVRLTDAEAARDLEHEPALTPLQGVLLAYLAGRLIGRLAGVR